MIKDWLWLHIPKNAGTTIGPQLPFEYRQLMYGLGSKGGWKKDKAAILDWFSINNIKIETCHESLLKRNDVAIDHLTLRELIEYKIVNQEDLKKLDIIVVIREPLERFLSYCNYSNTEPKVVVKNIKKFQHNRMLGCAHPKKYT